MLNRLLLLFGIIILLSALIIYSGILRKNYREVSEQIKENINETQSDKELNNPNFSGDIKMDLSSIHKSFTVVDAHCDTVDRIMQGVDLGVRSNQGHIDIPRLREGGVDVQVFACCIGRTGSQYALPYAKLATDMLNALQIHFQKHSGDITIALTPEDIRKAENQGKIAAILDIEGGRAIEDSLDNLKKFYNSGVRLMTITWNSNNWADASQEPPKHNGLNDFGKEVIKEMNRLGMIIDVSHSSDKTVWDVLETSSDPILASHSCVKAICNHPRNLSDELIKAISNGGGVICVNFYSVFIDQVFKDRREKGDLKQQPPPMSKVLDHIDHIVRVGGIDCVGLGSDFDGMNPPPIGLEDVSKMPKITEELLKRGYSVEEAGKIMGGNFLRLFNQVCKETLL